MFPELSRRRYESAFGDFDDDGRFFRIKVGFEGGPIVGVAINAFC
jgi:hypothetical protein